MFEADQGGHSDLADGHRASVDGRLWARAPDRAGRSDSVAWPVKMDQVEGGEGI